MRHKISLNQGWTFYKQGTAERVNLPHTWNGQDGQDGGDDYYRGSCYYERKFERPQMEADDQVYLEFMGVNAVAEVSVNGFPAGKHEGGYSAFRFNITGLLKEENVLEVVADNGKNERVYPQKADFTFYGGIYRDVNLVVVPGVHFAMEYFGAPGVKITPVLQDGRALVRVEAWLENGESLPENACVEVTVSGEGETAVKGSLSAQKLEDCPGGVKKAAFLLTIENPRLWQGVRDPYLYTAVVRLLGNEAESACPDTGTDEDGARQTAGDRARASGRVLDEVSLHFGCRSFSVDSERGFLLNGEAYPLRGVSRHQDREGVGNALTREMHREDMELIREIGANTVRLAHYQHDQYFYDLCDEYGLVVWAEIPYITAHMDGGRENTLSQMRELILQNHHHASICFWGISNEVTVGGVGEGVLENNRALHALCRELDPGRLTAMACAFLLEDDSDMLKITDLVSYNHYFGWYQGRVEDTDVWYDRFHAKHPELPVGLSEYGAEAVLQWQTAKPERGDYTEQYQALYHEHMLGMLETRPWIWCAYVWNMFDFAADGRDEGGVKGRNNKGLVTFDRKIKKDAFYLYKAYWSREPFVYIAGRRYANRAEKVSEITVYSNQEQVELFVNGASLGRRKGGPVFRFQAELEPENAVMAVAGEGLRDTVLLYGVEKPEASYVMPVQGGIENWFEDLLAPREGYFSPKDTLGELTELPEGLALFREVMAAYDARKKGAAAASRMTEAQRLSTMGSMGFGELLKRTATPREEAKGWLRKLQNIKKKS